MSSFRKRKETHLPPGTIVSMQSKQPITSSGIPSLDHILGGGINIGSVLLIEEDQYTVYSKVLVKYFLAEGVFSNHKTFLASLDDDPLQIYKKLPSPCEEALGEPNQQADDMRIAWRYNNLPQIDAEVSRNFGHNFDLTKPIQQSILDKHGGIIWNGKEAKSTSRGLFKNACFESLLEKISDLAEVSRQAQSSEACALSAACFRVCITSVGSPLWYEEHFAGDFIKFLTILKAILRNSVGICMLTIPMHLQSLLNTTLPLRIRNLVDYSVQLEAFAGSDKETNPIFKEYHGLLKIHKLNALNTINVTMPQTSDLAFKLRRRKFVIETLHLPPELQEKENQNVPNLGCGNPEKHLLEF